MRNTIKISITCLFILFQMCLAVYAGSPMGYWKTIDDVTGRPKAIIKISGSANYLSGTVVKLLPGAQKLCSPDCPGNLKNRPILGMTVMYGLKQSSSNPNEWSGGTIFDPKTGKQYRCMLTVSADGNSMEVRGYIGISLLGRSQTWYRVGK
jgi:uncharacterized protein (DUF2147 family)